MKSSKAGSVPEHELTQYLLGNLRAEERERLDELSIVDDEFAERLCAVENDLVDDYVRDQLRSDALRDFESHYLATDVRRQRVAMARTLFLAGTRPESSAESELSVARPISSAAVNLRSLVGLPRLRFAWLAVAAALALSVTTAWLAVENHRFRQQHRSSLAANSTLKQELQQPRAQSQYEQTLQNSHAPAAEESGIGKIGHSERLTSSIFLLPPTRGAATIPVAGVGQEDRWFRLQLALESDDFPQYQVDLMNFGSNKYVWHSGLVRSARVNHRRALSLLLPVGSLKSQRYAADVAGIAADGRHEMLGSYVFRIDQVKSRQDGGR
jgi:hypothetical protein